MIGQERIMGNGRSLLIYVVLLISRACIYKGEGLGDRVQVVSRRSIIDKNTVGQTDKPKQVSRE